MNSIGSDTSAGADGTPRRDLQATIETPVRRWFQFHLTTAIVMMFAAGFIFRLNFGEPQIVNILDVSERDQALQKNSEPCVNITVKGPGWPIANWRGCMSGPKSTEDEMIKQWHANAQNKMPGSAVASIFNIPIWIVLLFGIARISEFILRRRPSRK